MHWGSGDGVQEAQVRCELQPGATVKQLLEAAKAQLRGRITKSNIKLEAAVRTGEDRALRFLRNDDVGVADLHLRCSPALLHCVSIALVPLKLAVCGAWGTCCPCCGSGIGLRGAVCWHPVAWQPLGIAPSGVEQGSWGLHAA